MGLVKRENMQILCQYATLGGVLVIGNENIIFAIEHIIEIFG